MMAYQRSMANRQFESDAGPVLRNYASTCQANSRYPRRKASIARMLRACGTERWLTTLCERRLIMGNRDRQRKEPKRQKQPPKPRPATRA